MTSRFGSSSHSSHPAQSSSALPLNSVSPLPPHARTPSTDDEWQEGSIVDDFGDEPRSQKAHGFLPDWDEWGHRDANAAQNQTPPIATHNQADEDFFAALEKSTASTSSLPTASKQPPLPYPTAPPSPPMIDLRAKPPPPASHDDDDWFARFEKDSSTAMSRPANGPSRSNSAASAVNQDQLDSIYEARSSPMTFTPSARDSEEHKGQERDYFTRHGSVASATMQPKTQTRQTTSQPSSSWWGSIRGLGTDLARHAVDYLDPGVDFTDEELKIARKIGAVDISSEANTPSGSAGGTPLRSSTPIAPAAKDASSRSRPQATAPKPTTAGPPATVVSGAPGVDFRSLNPHWNTGSWSLSAKDPGRLDNEDAQDPTAPSSSSQKRILRDPLPVNLTGRRDETNPAISGFHSSHIQPYLPPRMKLGKTWQLLYSSDQDGVSLETLYRKVSAGLDPKQNARTNGPAMRSDSDRHDGWLRGSSSAARAALGADMTGAASWSSRRLGSGLTSVADAGIVLAIRDAEDRVFGSFVNEGFKNNPKGYYGSGDCFLWRTVQPKSSTPYVRTYPATLLNNYHIQSTASYLSFGGGVDGKYGLWIDSSFEKGVSARCETFDNDVLCDAEERGAKDKERETRFEPVIVEIWAVGID